MSKLVRNWSHRMDSSCSDRSPFYHGGHAQDHVMGAGVERLLPEALGNVQSQLKLLGDRPGWPNLKRFLDLKLHQRFEIFAFVEVLPPASAGILRVLIHMELDILDNPRLG